MIEFILENSRLLGGFVIAIVIGIAYTAWRAHREMGDYDKGMPE